MRIALVSYNFGEYCIRHANALLEHGQVMLILARDLGAPHSHLLDDQVDYRPFEKPRLRQPLRQFRVIRRILQDIGSFGPDVVHIQVGHLWFNLALPFLGRFPLVFTIHDPRHHLGDRASRRTPQAVLDFGYRRADQVIVHGRSLKEMVKGELEIPGPRIHVIPHIALGLDRIPPGESRRPSADRKILFFGRIWRYKGLDDLIRAQPLITSRFPDATIVIAGQGEDFTRYRDAMADPDRFLVHNRWISNEERAELFDSASLVVLPYVEATQSGVVPLAYAHRKAVVATRTGGLPDIVEDGVTGVLVPPGDPEALARAITELLGQPDLLESMGREGRRKLERECSGPVVAAQTARVYELAVQGRRTAESLRGPAGIGARDRV